MKRIIKIKLLPILGMIMLLACAESKYVSGQSTNDVPKKAFQLFNEAYKAYNYGEYLKAEELLLQAIKKHESYVDAYDLLGRTYRYMHDDEKAVRAFRNALKYNPNHFFALYELGNLYFSHAMLDSSAFFYQAALKNSTTEDKYTEKMRRQLSNIEFAKEAMANPVDMDPVNLGPKVNTSMEEYSPALTIDGNTIFYTWRNGQVDLYRANEDIYFAEKDNNGNWTQARPIGPPINTAENEGAFSVTADGKYIFFTSCNRMGGIGQCDIWITSNRYNSWGTPQNLGKPINSKHWESQPSISSDGRYLYFASDRPGGYGKIDLWVSTFTDTGWSEPRNLGPEINTSEDEQFPFIHPDGTTLYFSSYGHPGMGNADLYVTHMKPDGSFSKPENLGYPINSMGSDWNLIVARDGKTAIYSSDQNEGGFGGMDLYSFELPEASRANQVSYARGKVFDAETLAKLGATVELIPLDGGASTITFAPDKSGEFLVALRGNVRYALNVQREGYLFYSDHFDMPELKSTQPFELKIPLEKIKIGNSIVLKNVFFDTDRYELKPESRAELDKLYDFLQKNGSVRIEISGHTDDQGSAEHNKELSANRALAVYTYLTEKGIDGDRMSYVGYGASRPIADNSTEDGRAKNRRTEFSVIE